MHILDWWDSNRIEVQIPEKGSTDSSKENDGPEKISFDLTCTPCQHFTGRGIFDRFKSLWASWVVEEIVPPSSQEKGVKVFFGGDTGYRAVRDGQNEEEVPSCPVFEEIGERFGGFDFAMIPIGSVNSIPFTFPVQCITKPSTFFVSAGLTFRVHSCLRSTALRKTVCASSRTLEQRKHWACTGGTCASVLLRIIFLNFTLIGPGS